MKRDASRLPPFRRRARHAYTPPAAARLRVGFTRHVTKSRAASPRAAWFANRKMLQAFMPATFSLARHVAAGIRRDRLGWLATRHGTPLNIEMKAPAG